MTCQVICHKFNNSNNFNKVIRIFIYHNDFFDLDLSIYIIDAFKVEYSGDRTTEDMLKFMIDNKIISPISGGYKKGGKKSRTMKSKTKKNKYKKNKSKKGKSKKGKSKKGKSKK